MKMIFLDKIFDTKICINDNKKSSNWKKDEKVGFYFPLCEDCRKDSVREIIS